MRKQQKTKAGAQIIKAMREVLEHVEGKRALRTTVVYVDRTPGKERVLFSSKPKKRKWRTR